MKSWFDQCFDKLIAHEGGYVNDARDPGGETKYGISKRAYPQVDIKALTLDAAKEIYKRDYWDAMGIDQLPPGLQDFDAFVARVTHRVEAGDWTTEVGFGLAPGWFIDEAAAVAGPPAPEWPLPR